jgi:hypothetical protein
MTDFKKIAAELRKQAASLAPVAPPKLPTAAPAVPKPAAPKNALDPRTDKPAGMNLMHGIQTVSNGADTGASYSSFSRRLQGSPT